MGMPRKSGKTQILPLCWSSIDRVARMPPPYRDDLNAVHVVAEAKVDAEATLATA